MGMKQLSQCSSIPEAFFEMAAAYPAAVVYTQASLKEHQGRRERRSATFHEIKARVMGLAQFFRSAGVRKGDKVAIISQSRPEWMEADIAAQAAGAVVVSVYPSLIPEEIGFILFDSGARIVIAENQEQVDKLVHLLDHECVMPPTEERSQLSTRVAIERIVAFEAVSIPEVHEYLSAGVPRVVPYSQACTTPCGEAPLVHEALNRDDVASLVYTSGTTGAPKGVVQTHGNHLANVRQAKDSQLFTDGSSLAVFLPLAHAFARLMGYIGFLTPARLEFPAVVSSTSSRAEPESITRDLREGSADIIPAVPRIFEKMQSGIEHKARGKGIASRLLALTLWSARAVYAAKKEGRPPPAFAQCCHGLLGFIRRKVSRQLFGPRFRFAISGGAKLQPATNEFFDSLGILVLEGYGLTETVVATNINRPDQRRIGTVGPVLAPDIEVRIAEDGEICFRGPNVALGYFNRPTATAQSWDAEGWFHTGDLGSLSEDGFLSVTGRKKELIVTSGGKKIPPDPIEQRLKLCKFVSQVMIFGDDKPYCIALFCLNMNAVEIWAFEQGKKAGPEAVNEEAIRKEIWQHVERVNSGLASYESIKKIRILPEEFSVDNGLLTPTLKVKRGQVAKRYRELIEETYTQESPY
jgi:long-chain acyl-CoA synthetase